MRILAVDEEIPYPPNSGKRLRTYKLFEQLAAEHEIKWLCRSLEGVEYDSRGLLELGIDCEVIGPPIPRKSGLGFYGSLFANFFSRYPYVVARHRSGTMAARISEIARSDGIDLIHCEWTPYAVNMISPPVRLPAVLSTHNVESQIWQKTCRVQRNPLKKLYFLMQWKKMELFEKRQCRRFGRVLAVSEQDRRLLSRWAPFDRIDVVPNGVDTDYFQPAGTDMEEPNSVVFLGSLDWHPNIDAVEYFIGSIWPLVTKSLDGCRFIVIGRNPSPALRRMLPPDGSVEVRADVPDVRPHLKSASACVVPLRIGGGSRIKILEAFAMAKALVSTTVGAEGLEVQPGKHLLLADTPVGFASALVRLLRDGEMRARMGAAARALVEERHRWNVLARAVEESWKRATASACASMP